MPTLTELKVLVDWSQDDYQSLLQSNASADKIESAKCRAIKAQLIFDRVCTSTLDSLEMTDSEIAEMNISIKQLKRLGL